MNHLPESSPLKQSAGWRFSIGLSVLVVVFAGVRWLGMLNNLWLDEIWSLRMVQSIDSSWEIFSKLQHDNNHPLNSLYLYLVQPAASDWTYRLFSWFAGSMTVGLGALIGREQSRRWHADEGESRADIAGWVTGILFGGAYLLIHYSSEARGYAPAVAMGLLAYYASLRNARSPSITWSVLYSVSCVIGLLAHLAVVQVIVALGCVGLGQLLRGEGSLRARMMRFSGFHLPAGLFFTTYYFGFVRQMEIGGGPENQLLAVLGETAAYLVGLPVSDGTWALAVILAIMLIGFVLIWRRDRSSAVFYGLVIGVTPMVGILFSKFTLVFPRYFIVSAAFALLLTGYALSRLWWRGRWGRGLVIGLLALFLIGNGQHVARLAKEGRGDYALALRTLAERTPFNDVTISSDHDFRNFALVDYYQTVAKPPQRLIYYRREQVPPIGTQWRILHRIDGNAESPKHVTDERGNFYVKERVYPCEGLSGWTWIVYRNMQLDPKD